MSSEFLSQDEMNALLEGVSEENPSEVTPENTAKGGVQPYNVGHQERVVRGRMPTLDIIHDRFARLLRASFFKFMHRSPEISVGPVKTIKYSEFMRNLVVPTNLNIVSLNGLRGSALFIFEPQLIFTVVDNVFGGDGRFHSRGEGRDFTATEQRIIQRILDLVLKDYTQSWQEVYPLSFEYIRAEMHPQFANIVTSSETVITCSLSVELGNSGGDIKVCFPYAAIEPIKDILSTTSQNDQAEPDKRWLRLLSKQIQSADVQLVANLAEVEVTVAQLLKMKLGDIIPISLETHIHAAVDGVHLFDCRYGIMNGQYAIRIEKVLTKNLEDSTTQDQDNFGVLHGQ